MSGGVDKSQDSGVGGGMAYSLEVEKREVKEAGSLSKENAFYLADLVLANGALEQGWAII